MSSNAASFKHSMVAPLAVFLCLFAFSPWASGAGGKPPPGLLLPASAPRSAAAPSGRGGPPPVQDSAQDAGTPVAFDTQAALALPVGGEARIALPRLGTLAVVHDRQETHPNGDTTWVGHFKGYGDDYRVVVTAGAKGVAGRIVSPDGEFSLVPGPNGGTWLRDNSRAGLVSAMQDVDDAVAVPPAPAVPVVPRAAVTKAVTEEWCGIAVRCQDIPAPPPTDPVPPADPNAQATIDLMLVYTAGMVQRYGDGLQTRLNNLVAIANQAYIDSGIHITLRLVHTVEVDYGSSGLSQALNDITYGNGVFSGISTLRKQYGADLVQLVISTTNSCGGAGKGWLNSVPQADFDYSVITDASLDGCGQFVTLAHELGHNMGADHDRSHASLNIDLGYAYGYGIVGKFADIMSSGYISAPVVTKFSNPNITCGPDSDPCGIAPGQPNAADSAQTLNDNRWTVAAAMPSTLAAPTATLTATPAAVGYGESSALAWSSTGATSCSAATSDGWAGAVPLAGNVAVSGLAATTAYTLTCQGPGRTAAASATVDVGPPPAGCLFDWAEKAYPGLFPPAGRESGVSGIYTYRHYPAADAYVGISSADGHVYYLGPDRKLQDEGPLFKWLPLAGCQ